MQRFAFLVSLLICMIISNVLKAQVIFNGDFEDINRNNKLPSGWQYSTDDGYVLKLDSTVVQKGKYSLSITSKTSGGKYGFISYYIRQNFAGKKLQLKGFIKTENVSGYAGLYGRVDGTDAFSLNDQNIKGTTDWKEYTINLPYDSYNALQISIDAAIAGTGKIWIDDLRLYIDGKPVEQAVVIPRVIPNAKTDDAFANSSGISVVNNDAQTVGNLTLLAQVWGFVKYHLPAVAKSHFNMDAELFRVMPSVIQAKNYKEASNAIEQWIDKLGAPAPCSNCGKMESQPAIKPDYGDLFNKDVVSASLIGKLTYILNNRNTGKSYYIDMAPGVVNPIFKNELPYSQMDYPDAGYRLLCLFRYWNMVQYFAPYKPIIGQDWNKVLSSFIPRFIAAKDATDYDLTTLALIATINDTHANVWSSLKALLEYRGKLSPPFQGKFVEEQLTVMGYYNDTLNVKQNFKIGDVIKTINGVSITELVKKNLPITPASNYETQLRDMPQAFLLRGNAPEFTYEIIRDGKTLNVTQVNLPRTKINYAALDPLGPNDPAYKLIDGNIAYLYPGKYYNKDLEAIKKMFNGTKGIIIDMRCYPSEFMPFTFVPYIKSGDNNFVKFTVGSVANPGQFITGKELNIKPTNEYKGKVVVIVNEQTQSQAEYTTMAFQSSPNVTVIGSTTAGADGNVSSIILPGGINTMISGIGVFYPDGTPTQRKGVRIDEIVKPTIQGIKAGKDELLERAKTIILN